MRGLEGQFRIVLALGHRKLQGQCAMQFGNVLSASQKWCDCEAGYGAVPIFLIL